MLTPPPPVTTSPKTMCSNSSSRTTSTSSGQRVSSLLTGICVYCQFWNFSNKASCNILHFVKQNSFKVHKFFLNSQGCLVFSIVKSILFIVDRRVDAMIGARTYRIVFVEFAHVTSRQDGPIRRQHTTPVTNHSPGHESSNNPAWASIFFCQYMDQREERTE